MDYISILNLSSEDLLNWLLGEFTVPVPERISNADDLKSVHELLLKLSSYYSYLSSLSSYAKIYARNMKRTSSKEDYEDAVDKKEIINNMTEAIKHQYSAVSRAATLYLEATKEIGMR